ncbi:methyltransferase domain-containing protein [Kineosporia sp. J2-2]|uniref:Methyltransferase domain-containing protein n=1 Tax=Kineosporia corallincola TaxID=2835133 RepID=A0ABS5TF90_9ACTN|nr:class I SAM-dependent methyltransferase [Kineosporia corallincola]MBT0769720.1 methyltransferase domain-containing protein [Kineosporia corallincola]
MNLAGTSSGSDTAARPASAAANGTATPAADRAEGKKETAASSVKRSPATGSEGGRGLSSSTAGKGAEGAGYARDRFAGLVGARVLRREKMPYGDALEVGAGSTFGFSLGLLQSGVVNRLWISDLATSALAAARRRSEQLGLGIAGDELADPEMLPFDDASFDLVVAHALLHRRMDPAGTLTEVLRVLRPGGRFVITGESTRVRDWASPGFVRTEGGAGRAGMSRAGKARARLPERLRTLTGAPDASPTVPDRLVEVAAEAGAREVKVKPEELLATVLPYPGAEPGPAVIRSRERLAVLDRKLSQVLPVTAFPTVGLTGVRAEPV